MREHLSESLELSHKHAYVCMNTRILCICMYTCMRRSAASIFKMRLTKERGISVAHDNFEAIFPCVSEIIRLYGISCRLP